jgi:hypothetical protein
LIVMKEKPIPRQTRQQVIAALSQIIGLPLTAVRRTADIRTFQFGVLRPVDRGSVGDFALHVQCPWRIEGPDGLVTGRSDLWEPVDTDAPYDAEWDYEQSPNLQDTQIDRWLTESEIALVVQRVDADEFGGVVIWFGEGYALRTFTSGTRGEDWRLFRPNSSDPHLVISGGTVE